MPTLRIEHAVRDYDTWKKRFDSDPADRQKSGVRGYKVLRAIDDPNLVLIDLDFDNRENAQAFLDQQRNVVWQSPGAKEAIVGSPKANIVEATESKLF